MFNVQVKGNVRCNGIIPPGSGGMAKRGIHNTTAMSPNRGHTISDTKLKFSDRLKAYLSTDGLRSDASEFDDPYTFSDGEVKPINNSKSGIVVKKCSDMRVKDAKTKVISGNVDSVVKSEQNSGKTMSRLQAQIARNKVTVKHNRNSPDLKYDKNHFDKNTKHSIIGLVNNVNSNTTKPRRLPSGKPIPAHLRARRASAKVIQQHEGSLQRISTSGTSSMSTITPSGSVGITTTTVSLRRWHAPHQYGLLDENEEESDEESCLYQRHWFNKELECYRVQLLTSEDGPRETRLELTLSELKRQLLQMKRSRVGHFRSIPATSVRSFVTEITQNLTRRRRKRSPTKGSSAGLMNGRMCSKENCSRVALPCTKHCVMHIMANTEQVLFDHCTAKFADNTQCSVPVFDITHELPLCIEHARKRDNYNKMCLETKPKKPRRKIKPSAMIRPQKRNKKRKKPPQKNTELTLTQTVINSVNNVSDVTELNVCETSSAYESSEEIALGTLSESEFVTIKGEDHIGDQDVVEQVLAMQDEVGGDLELVVEQTLVTQASRLLEETDFTNVLNQIPADEFNDLFAVDRNGEYEPSREETEELERALEAVDEDVKSLEKLSQTQGLLDSLLDEHTLVESLVQIPDVFHHNGYEVQCIDSPGSHQASPRQLQGFHPSLHGVEGLLPVQTQAHTPS